MKPIVPFIHGLNDEQEALWLAAFAKHQYPFDVRLPHQLTAMDAERVEVALVANPDPTDLLVYSNLIWVQSLWAGVEKLISVLPNDRVKVARLIDPNLSLVMSEAVLAWTFYLHRNMHAYATQQVKKEWRQRPLKRPCDVTIGVLGLGELGHVAATRLMQNGFNVTGWSRSPKSMDGIATCHGETGLTALLAQSDIVVNLLPLTPDTRHLLNASRFAEMKTGASLINFGRGACLNELDLMQSLDAEHLSHAVLDVFVTEPLPEDSPLWVHPNITILPHISAPTDKQTASGQVAATLSAWFASRTMPNFVDLQKGY